MAIAAASWLDTAHQSDWAEKPFFAETVELLRSVRDHDFDSLAELCDDDFGIVDLDQSGGSVMVRTRTEWENWFRRLFSELDAVGADTDSEILDYQALASPDMGYSVVEFRQSLTMAGMSALFDCVATVIWKRTDSGWKESRWHVSLLSTEIPDGFPTGA
ncbi:MAG: nuclear transport factor 2 family protein [Acidimicrobiia bacterium]|nr:nuclear transport factor 2 family protein [Acidimicrobiia bacterium]